MSASKFCINDYDNSGGTGTLSSSGSERAEAEVAVEQAWSELAAVEREQEAARAERERVERQLEQVRLRGAQLEQVTLLMDISLSNTIYLDYYS